MIFDNYKTTEYFINQLTQILPYSYSTGKKIKQFFDRPRMKIKDQGERNQKPLNFTHACNESIRFKSMGVTNAVI